MLVTAKQMTRRATELARRLRACDNGMAFVEFALGLPLVTTLGLCGLETASLAMAHLRVSNIAMMTSDNAARVRDAIDEANVIELLTGAKMAGDTIDFRNNGRIILSSIEPNTAGPNGTSNGQWIRWQRCDGRMGTLPRYGVEGTGQNDSTLQAVGPPDNRISAAPGTAVMLVEVEYDYQPIVSNQIFGRQTIRYENAFNVRQRTNQQLKNAGNLSAGQKRTCNKFEA